jgi:hypothetical protein
LISSSQLSPAGGFDLREVNWGGTNPGIADGFEPTIVRARNRVWYALPIAQLTKSPPGRRRKWIVYILYFPQFSSQNLTLASALPPEREAVITLDAG